MWFFALVHECVLHPGAREDSGSAGTGVTGACAVVGVLRVKPRSSQEQPLLQLSPWLFLNRGSGIPEWPQMSYVAKVSLELLTLYPLPLECRDFRCVLPCLAPELFLVEVIELALEC